MELYYAFVYCNKTSENQKNNRKWGFFYIIFLQRKHLLEFHKAYIEKPTSLLELEILAVGGAS